MRIGTWLAVCLLWGAALTGQAVRLAYPAMPNAKSAYRYDVAVTGTISSPKGTTTTPLDLQARARVVEQVTAVSGAVATLRMLIKNAALTGTYGEEAVDETLPDNVVTFQRAPTGAISQVRDATPAETTQLPGMDDLWRLFIRFGQRLRLPEDDVYPGSTWRTEEPIAMADGRRLTLVTDSTLVGGKVVDGVSYLQINSRYTAKTPDRKANDEKPTALRVDFTIDGTSQLLFNATTGAIFRSAFNVDLTSDTAYHNPNTGTDTPAMHGAFHLKGTAHLTE